MGDHSDSLHAAIAIALRDTGGCLRIPGQEHIKRFVIERWHMEPKVLARPGALDVGDPAWGRHLEIRRT